MCSLWRPLVSVLNSEESVGPLSLSHHTSFLWLLFFNSFIFINLFPCSFVSRLCVWYKTVTMFSSARGRCRASNRQKTEQKMILLAEVKENRSTRVLFPVLVWSCLRPCCLALFPVHSDFPWCVAPAVPHSSLLLWIFVTSSLLLSVSVCSVFQFIIRSTLDYVLFNLWIISFVWTSDT